MKLFNAVIIVVFVMLGLVALGVVATFSGRGGDSVGAVEVWGPLPDDVVGEHINEIGVSRTGFDTVRYTALPADTFIPSLVEAIAANRGPDLVIFPAEYLYLHSDKLVTIPFSSISRRQFQDTYIEAGEILLNAEGIRGIPYLVDPLVLYWNRTLFSAASIARPPRYWDEVSENARLLTRANEAGSLTQSAIALGEWDNVNHAKEILLSLLRQLGNAAVAYGEKGIDVTFSSHTAGSVSSAESVLRYYTEFSNPVKQVYSWNRSQPDSRDAFLEGTVAMYIGFASELRSIREANPNLNFDVASLPTARGGSPSVASRMYIVAVPRGARNTDGAFSAAVVLSSSEAQTLLREQTGLPSVRRDLLTVSPDDPYAVIFRDAALNAFVFLDPDPLQTDGIFARAVGNIASGKLRVHESVVSANGELRALIKVR